VTNEALLERSRLFRVLSDVVARVWQARRSSVVAATVDGFGEAWRHAGWRDRRRAVGFVLVVGVAVHVGLSMLLAPPPGWQWLIVPGLGLAIGALLLMASGTARSSRAARPASPAPPAPDERGAPS
jgi:hypothetical protein